MRRFWKMVLVVVVVTGMVIAAEGPGAKPATRPVKGPEPKAARIEVVGKSLVVNGTEISLPVKNEKLFEVLGKPERRAELANTIHTWDAYGILGYERPETGEIDGFHICFDKLDYKFWPKNTFSGTCTVDGATVALGTTPATVNEGKKGKPFVQDELIKFWWTVDHGDFWLVFHTPGKAEPKESKACTELTIEVRKKR